MHTLRDNKFLGSRLAHGLIQNSIKKFLGRLSLKHGKFPKNSPRFYGILAPHAENRKNVVSKPDLSQPPQLQLFSGSDNASDDDVPKNRKPSRLSWSKLLARVFKIDVTICPMCNGTMKITDAVTKNENVKPILNGLTDQNPRDGPLTAQLVMNI